MHYLGLADVLTPPKPVVVVPPVPVLPKASSYELMAPGGGYTVQGLTVTCSTDCFFYPCLSCAALPTTAVTVWVVTVNQFTGDLFTGLCCSDVTAGASSYEHKSIYAWSSGYEWNGSGQNKSSPHGYFQTSDRIVMRFDPIKAVLVMRIARLAGQRFAIQLPSFVVNDAHMYLAAFEVGTSVTVSDPTAGDAALE